MNHRIHLSRLSMLFFVFMLTACPQDWHLVVVPGEELLVPKLCVSRFPNCNGSGVQFSRFYIAELDDQGYEHRFVWQIEFVGLNVNLSILKGLTYGVVPDGWRSEIKPSKLEVGRWYSVYGRFYFRPINIDGKIEYDIKSINPIRDS